MFSISHMVFDGIEVLFQLFETSVEM